MKNKFGFNLSWYCKDAAVTLEENKETDGNIWPEVEIHGETESGEEVYTTVKVVELLECAGNEIDNLTRIGNEVSEARDNLLREVVELRRDLQKCREHNKRLETIINNK